LAKHILIVDDEKRIRDVVEYALEKDGYRVSSVADGLEALAAVERDPPGQVHAEDFRLRRRHPYGQFSLALKRAALGRPPGHPGGRGDR